MTDQTLPPSELTTPFFVVGVQRSGTTMLRLMLNNHPRLHVPFESDFIVPFWKKHSQYGDLAISDNLNKLLHDIANHPTVKRAGLIPDTKGILDKHPTTYAQVVASIFDALAKRAGKSRWGDKTPGYELDLDSLVSIFPGSKIIHLVRDGRDVTLSRESMSWSPSHHLPTLARDWSWRTTLCHKMGSLLGPHFQEIRYEDLVVDPVGTLKIICRFLGEEYSDDLLSYHKNSDFDMPQESLQWHRNSVSPPDASKVFEWRRRMSRADRVVFDQIAGDALRLFDYDVGPTSATLGSRLRTLHYLFMRRW